jgi:hypothetical protein
MLYVIVQQLACMKILFGSFSQVWQVFTCVIFNSLFENFIVVKTFLSFAKHSTLCPVAYSSRRSNFKGTGFNLFCNLKKKV